MLARMEPLQYGASRISIIFLPVFMDIKYISWAEKQLGGKAAVFKEPHGDQSIVYRLTVSSGDYFLKIASGLEKEHERLLWLEGKLPVPKVIGFTRIEDKEALLLSSVEGTNLAELAKEWTSDVVINKLVEALRKFHAVAIKDCPFGSPKPDAALVHGDACLPNFIFKDGILSGYIDVGDMRIGEKEIDLSAAVWSLQYNLGPGHGLRFLENYGIKDATEELVEKLRLQYEAMQEGWGLI